MGTRSSLASLWDDCHNKATRCDVSGIVPAEARWLRLILHSTADGAVWFDETSLERVK